MNISELISLLTKMKDENGDLPIWILHEWSEPINKLQVEDEYQNPHILRDYLPKRVEIS